MLDADLGSGASERTALPWNVSITTGDGDDMLHATIDGSASVRMAVDLGRGDDASIFELHEVDMPNPVELTVHGGLGGDDIRVICGFNPQPEPPGMPQIAGALEGPEEMPALRLMIDGDEGSDRLQASLSFNPNGTRRVTAQLLGGAGKDDLMLDVMGISDDLLDALIDGGPGIDTAHHTANVRVVNCER